MSAFKLTSAKVKVQIEAELGKICLTVFTCGQEAIITCKELAKRARQSTLEKNSKILFRAIMLCNFVRK